MIVQEIHRPRKPNIKSFQATMIPPQKNRHTISRAKWMTALSYTKNDLEHPQLK